MGTVEYRGKTYEISEMGEDVLADFGAEVAAGEMSSDEAIFTVLRAEGLIEIPEMAGESIFKGDPKKQAEFAKIDPYLADFKYR